MKLELKLCLNPERTERTKSDNVMECGGKLRWEGRAPADTFFNVKLYLI